MTDKEKIFEILKTYVKKNGIMASTVILAEYAEELAKNGLVFSEELSAENERLKAVSEAELDTIHNLGEDYEKALEEINRQKAEIERLHNLQKPTEASGFRVENGKVVFYTNMLNGYRHEFKDLEAVVRDLNLMLQNSYKNDQIIGFYKNTIENQVSELKTAKSEAIKEFAERLKATDTADLVGEQYINGEIYGYFYSAAFERKIDNLVKEMVGDDNVV